jgi:hypothetical protein
MSVPICAEEAEAESVYFISRSSLIQTPLARPTVLGAGEGGCRGGGDGNGDGDGDNTTAGTLSGMAQMPTALAVNTPSSVSNQSLRFAVQRTSVLLSTGKKGSYRR